MGRKIGLLTSGGDCQGLNAALRGVAKSLYEQISDLELIGFRDGYRGLIQNDCHLMTPEDFSGILTLGGTILGTSRQPFRLLAEPAIPEQPDGPTRLEAMVRTYQQHSLDALVILGGNGTHKTAHALATAGLNVVTLPKTIDNDLWGTDVSFGFQSAVDLATLVIDNIHTTATSHGRIFIIELMGHEAGWLTLHAGVAGGADVILIPEIPCRLDAIIRSLREREAKHKRFSIIALAEGARTVEEAGLSKKERRRLHDQEIFPSAAYRLAKALEQQTGQEIRVTVPGHFQRGGQPVAADRVLATTLGTAAADLVVRGQYGQMAGIRDGRTVAVPLAEVAGKLRLVPADAQLVRAARAIGTSFGDA
jgi:6-phosphofructokinase 1